MKLNNSFAKILCEIIEDTNRKAFITIIPKHTGFGLHTYLMTRLDKYDPVTVSPRLCDLYDLKKDLVDICKELNERKSPSVLLFDINLVTDKEIIPFVRDFAIKRYYMSNNNKVSLADNVTIIVVLDENICGQVKTDPEWKCSYLYETTSDTTFYTLNFSNAESSLMKTALSYTVNDFKSRHSDMSTPYESVLDKLNSSDSITLPEHFVELLNHAMRFYSSKNPEHKSDCDALMEKISETPEDADE